MEQSFPRQNQFLKIGDYVCLKIKAELKEITGTPKEKDIKKPKEKSAEQLKIEETLKRLKEEKDLTNKIVKELEKELKEAIKEGLEQDKMISFLEHRANILRDERQQEKIQKNFESNYNKFINTLNSDLNDLDEAKKQEIKDSLISLSATIEETINDLDE